LCPDLNLLATILEVYLQKSVWLCSAAAEQGDQIGRFFTNWATFKGRRRFFRKIKSPKKWRLFGRFLGL
jgi:hypothetical protein